MFEFYRIMAVSKPICPVCCDEPFLPTTLNIFKKDFADGDVKGIKKCPATNKNPICLTCIRDFINAQIGDALVCPYNCCHGYKGPRLFQTYGHSLRSNTDYAEDCMWTMMYSYNVLNKKCNRCDHTCDTLEETLNHLRKDCIKRKIPCNYCKVLVPFDEQEVHKLSCSLASFKLI